jgi:hypothetical protein
MIRDTDEISIKLVGDFSSPLADKLQKATMSALELDHKLPDSVRLMSGMSGKKYRYLINKMWRGFLKIRNGILVYILCSLS